MKKNFEGKRDNFIAVDFPEAEAIAFTDTRHNSVVICSYRDLTALINWLTVLESELVYKSIKTTPDL